MLYLIAHKVRGEAVFDVAEPAKFEDGEEYWIIPTSGHRAYPYFFIPISELWIGGELQFIRMVDDLPSDLRDHYQIEEHHSPKPTKSINLEELGL